MFDHVKRMNVDDLVRRCERFNIPDGRRSRGRSKKSLDEVIRENLKVIGSTEDVAHDRGLWRDMIKVLDHREIAS